MKQIAYIGTYSKGPDGGIFRVEIDDETAELKVLDTTPVENPSHLALAHNGKSLFAASEIGSFNGKNGGAAAVCAVDAEGKLTYINSVGTDGASPCYIASSPDDRFAYVANYSEGTATVLAVEESGALKEEEKLIVVHQGKGPNEQRQEKPHVHITRITPDGKYLAVCDLGLDAVVLYPLCDKCGLNSKAGSFVRTEPGNGPRHIEFSRDGKFAYVVTEMGNTVRTYAYEDGRLTFLSAYNTLPEDFTGNSIAGAIHFAPDGKTLVASNRGHDSLVLFEADGGKLTRKQIVRIGGKVPREFAYTKNGKFVFVCNQNSSDITVLKVLQDGTLELTDIRYEFPRPVCLIWKD